MPFIHGTTSKLKFVHESYELIKLQHLEKKEKKIMFFYIQNKKTKHKIHCIYYVILKIRASKIFRVEDAVVCVCNISNVSILHLM